MLDFFRRGIKSWVAKILLALLIVSFAVWGIGDIFTGGRSITVASVGETEVDSEKFADAVLRQRSVLSQRAGRMVSFADIRAGGLDQQILTALVREAAYAEELSKLGIAIPSSAVRDTIAQNPSFQGVDGNFSQFAYQSILSQQGYSPRTFETLTASLLGEQILNDAVTSAVEAPDVLAEAIARFDGEQRAVSVLRLPIAAATDPGQPEDSVLATWFEENAENFREPERRWGMFIRVDPAALAADLAPDEAEIRAFYEANRDSYELEARRTVEQIIFEDGVAAQDAADRLAAGETTFAEVAAAQNLTLEDIALGNVTRDDLADATAEAAFALTEPGTTGPIEGIFGSILLNVTAVQLGGVQPFEDVQDQISSGIARERARAAVTQKVNQLDDIRAGGADLQELSEQTELPLVVFEGLGADGSVASGAVPAVAGDAEFFGEVFGAAEGEERDIVELTDGSYVLVMVDRVEAAHNPALDAVKDRAVVAWQDAQRLQAQEARASELVTGEADFAAVATVLNQEPAVLAPFARSDIPPELSPSLVEAIFEADAGALIIGERRDGSAVIIAEVTEVAAMDPADLALESDQLGEVLSDSIARDQLEYYARAIEERHGALVNNGAIDTIFEQLSQSGAGVGGM